MNHLEPPMYPPIGLSERNAEADRLRIIRARKRIAQLEAENKRLREALQKAYELIEDGAAMGFVADVIDEALAGEEG